MATPVDEHVAQAVFEQRLRQRTPSLWALYAVLALNIGVWLANLADGVHATQPTTADLFRWGANSASAVVRDGELWRLLSATVLHGGLVHLALNMWALWVAGQWVIRWYGNAPFLLLYWGSALAGSALSLHFSAQQSVSVGASGAVFGVLGALLTGVWQHRRRVPRGVVTQLLGSQALFVVISLGQGFVRPGIDNAAHVGGLLAGVVMAWLLVELVDEDASAGLRRRRQWLAAGCVALAVTGLVWAAPAGVDHRQRLATQAALRELLPRLQQADDALRRDALAQKEGRMSQAAFIDALAQRHIPVYRESSRQLQSLAAEPPLPLLEHLRERQGLMLETMEIEVGVARGTRDPIPARLRLRELRQQLEANRQALEKPAP